LSGELIALLSALLWAMASVLLTVGAKQIHVIPLNLVRCVVSTAFFWVLLPFFGGFQSLAAIPPATWLWLVVSVLGLLVIGDTLYFRSMDLAGVSWALPVASINPLWAVILAAVFVDEPLTWSLVLGALLVIGGVILVSRSAGPADLVVPANAAAPVASAGQADPAGPADLAGPMGPWALTNPAAPGVATNSGSVASSSARRTGLLLAFAVSVLWSVGQVALKLATADMHSVVANSVRQPLAMVMLLGLTLARGQWRELTRLDRRSWGIIAIASLVGTGFGTLFFVMAIQLTGAGRTAVLTSTAPLLALPFSMLWLRERPTRWTVVGTLLTTAGIGLVV
jgi:transporter family protein